MSLEHGTARARWTLAATVLASSMAFVDGTVVNVALPAIGKAFGGSISSLTWVINAYTLTLAAFILLGGSLGDRFGRRRIFLIGTIWFAIGSLICGVAPNLVTLIVARAFQGIGGALLTPGSLAILQTSFRASDRARAIGTWSGWSGIAGAAGPLLGGWLIEVASWRWVFLVNLPFAITVVWISFRSVPESRSPDEGGLDPLGAALGALALGFLTSGWWFAGVAALVAFLVREKYAAHPMLPLGIFSSRLFSAVNLVTFAVYAALGGMFFWLVLQLQVVAHFSPIAAGLALVPVTILLLLLSSRMGALSQRIGPRLPMTIGPLLAAAGTAWLVQIGSNSSYVRDVLPPMIVLGLGLAFTVAPLTATVLAAAPDRHAGLASGVNNAVARTASLLAVAALPAIAHATDFRDASLLTPAYHRAIWCCAALLAAGGVLSALLVRTARGDLVLHRGSQAR